MRNWDFKFSIPKKKSLEVFNSAIRNLNSALEETIWHILMISSSKGALW